MSEVLNKLDPQRTIYLRGSDGYGAMATIVNASTSGFTLRGVFRAHDDFAVLVLLDADNVFEHYSIRYLPDFRTSGLTLTYDYSTSGVQAIDSVKYPTTDWQRLDVITSTGTPLLCSLWDRAVYKSGSFTAASATLTITGTPAVGDVITLFVNGTGFACTATAGMAAADVAGNLAYQIGSYDWATFASSSVSVLAQWTGSASLTLIFARTGKVQVSGAQMTWQANGSLPSQTFQGLQPGDPFLLVSPASGTAYGLYTVSSVTNSKLLTLASSTAATNGSTYTYVAPMGGNDGNALTCYAVLQASGMSVTGSVLPFAGGNSDGVVWTITVNFDTLYGVTAANATNPAATTYPTGDLRQAWTTFAPQIAAGVAYSDTEWSATFANWTVTDAYGNRALKVAGPGSVRVGSGDSWVSYTGAWSVLNANNYYRGFARNSNNAGDSITIRYACNFTHDLWIGTELYVDRRDVTIALDGGAATSFVTYLNTGTPLLARRKALSGIAAGTHSVLITLGAANASATASLYYGWLFDFLEAVVASDVPDPVSTYSNVTAALDYDTDATYKMPPARLVWALRKLGLLAQVNLYLGVFWWAQRSRVGGVLNDVTVTFGGTWAAGSDSAYVSINPLGDTSRTSASGFKIGKAVAPGDNGTTIAAHFAYYINAASVGFWASASAGTLTITQRAPNGEYTATIVAWATTSGGSVAASGTGNINVGVDGNWQLLDTASPIVNVAVRSWLSDLYSTLGSFGMGCSTAISMELVNPPAGYVAMFADGKAVGTDTGFSSLQSNHTRLGGSNVLALQKALLAELALLKTNAGIPVYLQLGEFLWWYFPEFQSVPILTLSGSSPMTIAAALNGSAQALGYVYAISSSTTYIGVAGALASPVRSGGAQVGDTLAVFISGAQGDTSINGVWQGTVGPDTSHITIPVASSGTWSTSTGVLTVLAAHGLPSGSTATIAGVTGCTSANGTWTISAPSAYSFTINATANGAWAGGGTFSGGGMAFYDPETTTAASSALGRSLASFWSQDDDPTINGGADATFLANRMMAHFTTLINYIQGLYSGAKFELLFPHDVSVSPLYWNIQWPYAQGGRLNRAVDWPAGMQTRSGSGFDRLKMEALSWGASYRSLDLAKLEQAWPQRSPNNWPSANTACLIPIFNGGCPWKAEFLAAVNAGIPLIVFWAWDHIGLLGLDWPLPRNSAKAGTS